LLDEEKATKYCPELEEIRKMLDAAVNKAWPPGDNAGAFASKVHKLVKEAIETFNQSRPSEKQLGEPEVSFRKDGTSTKRFEKGTIRPDLNNRKEKAWCVFEHKISVAATLDDKRMDEIAIRLSKTRGLSPKGTTPDWLIVIETKPLNAPELRKMFQGSPADR
jgi:hypothetical protein